MSQYSPIYKTRLQPYQHLQPIGIVWLISICAGLALLPMLAFIGHKVFWMILFMFILTISALWIMIQRNKTDRQVFEDITLWKDRIQITHQKPNKAILTWEGDPYWAKLTLHETAKIEHYITIREKGREIEIGAFLSPEERLEFYTTLQAHLSDVKR